MGFHMNLLIVKEKIKGLGIVELVCQRSVIKKRVTTTVLERQFFSWDIHLQRKINESYL